MDKCSVCGQPAHIQIRSGADHLYACSVVHLYPSQALQEMFEAPMLFKPVDA